MHNWIMQGSSISPSSISCLTNTRCPVSNTSSSGLTPECLDRFRHSPQRRRRVGHDVIAEREIHGSAIERANLGQKLGHMSEALARADHIRAVGIERQRMFARAEHHVAAHAGRQVDDDVDVSRSNAIDDLAIEMRRRRAALPVSGSRTWI